MELGGIMQQAKAMQSKMQEVHDRLAGMHVAGQSGGGLVKVIMTGRHDVKSLVIDPASLKEAAQDGQAGAEGRKVLQSMIAAAINDAVRRIEEATREEMGKMAQGFNLPPEFLQGQAGEGDEG